MSSARLYAVEHCASRETSIRLIFAARHHGAVPAIFWLIALTTFASVEMLSGDGYLVRPPLGFAPVPLDSYRGSRLGVISSDAEANGFLSAAFTNDKIAGTVTMLISVVDGAFSATPAGRDEFSVAAMKHFEELKTKFAIERVDLIFIRGPRVELTGTLTDEGRQRQVLIAAMPGRRQHRVVVFSLPVGEFPRWAPLIRTSLETFQNTEGPAFWTGNKIAASAALLGAGVLTWMFLSQNRKGARAPKAARR